MFAQQMTAVATFQNIGIEVTVTGAVPAGASIATGVRKTEDAGAYREAMPLCRVASNVFAGSLVLLESGRSYSVRLISPLLPGGTQVVSVATRSEACPVPTNRVLYVATNGNDAANGLTATNALRTVVEALSRAQPGDRIRLGEGRYFEGDFSITRHGQPLAPIALEGEPGRSVVLDGTDPAFVPAWQFFEEGIYRTASAAQPNNAYLNGRHFFNFQTLENLRTDPYGQGTGYCADGTHLYARFPGGAPGTNRFTIPRYTAAVTLEASHWQIRGLEFCYYGYGEYHRGIYLNGASSNWIENCFFHHNGVGVAIKRAANFNVVQQCRFEESPLDEWSWNAIKQGSSGGYEAGGIYVYGDAIANQGNVIRHNIFSHQFDGSHLLSEVAAGYTRHLDFYSNRVEHCGDDGIELDGAGSNIRVYGNVFDDFLTGISVAPCTRGPTYIFRNVLANWHRVDIYDGYPFKFNHGYSSSIDWVHLYHNTCRTETPGQNGFLFKQYSHWTNIVSRNNLFAGTLYALESWSAVNPVDFDYDNLYSTDPAYYVRWAGVSYTNLAAFTAATGQEAHGLSVEPRFENVAAADYRLRSDSPLLDRALRIPGLNDAFTGAAPDIGAFEFVHFASELQMQPDGLSLEWKTIPGMEYQVQSAAETDANAWTDETGWLTATGSTFDTPALSAESSWRLYRLMER